MFDAISAARLATGHNLTLTAEAIDAMLDELGLAMSERTWHALFPPA